MHQIQTAKKVALTESYWPADISRPIIDSTLHQALQNVVSTAPQRLALVEGIYDSAARRTWTYEQLLQDVQQTAAALLKYFKPGDRIAMWANNVPEWILLLYGCSMAGMVLVTVNPAYKARELKYVLEKSEAAGLIYMENYRGTDTAAIAREVAAELPLLHQLTGLSTFAEFMASADGAVNFPDVQPQDNCIIMFTSGTTGAQKGVMFHHRGILNVTNFTQERGGLDEGGVFVNPMPMFHIGSLGHAGVGSVIRGATHVLAIEWNTNLYMELVERYGGTYSLLVPTMVEAILASPDRERFDLSTLKRFISGAAMVEASLIRRTAATLGCSISNVYGATEMQGVICGVYHNDAEIDKTETIGQPMPQVEVKIADPQTGAVLPLNTPGEICIRGYQAMIGYFNMPEETAKTLDADGWLHSGDIGTMDARGYLKITGRMKEVIIPGGENIYPREVEILLQEHPKVETAAVVGLPDQYWGEQVAAVILPVSANDLPSVDELHTYCRKHLAHYKTPRFWSFVDNFPLTETGKIQKFKLVEALTKGDLVAQQS
ncbi:MAG: class I adenylate-forming enzyme family protein [Porticoccaceae bacterium]